MKTVSFLLDKHKAMLYHCISQVTQWRCAVEFCFDNNIPIYIQLVEQLKIYIISGELAPGQRLPSVRELAMEAIRHMFLMRHNHLRSITIQVLIQVLVVAHMIFTVETTREVEIAFLKLISIIRITHMALIQ